RTPVDRRAPALTRLRLRAGDASSAATFVEAVERRTTETQRHGGQTRCPRRAAAVGVFQLAVFSAQPVSLCLCGLPRGAEVETATARLRQICKLDCSRGGRDRSPAPLVSCRCTPRRSLARGTVIAIEGDAQREVPMYWVFVAVFTGIAFAWVTLRR